MKFLKIFLIFITSHTLSLNLSATVIITHGMGTNGISYYQKSSYINSIKTSAKNIGHSTKTVTWLSEKDPNEKYAGLLPKERIRGAVKIAKKILDELQKEGAVILVGHSYGGQVMKCACRLLNPNNKKIEDSFIYDLIQIIKTLIEPSKTHEDKFLKPSEIISIISVGWHLTNGIISAIESAHVVNENLIKFIKQNISLSTNEEIKQEWAKAFDEITKYKKQLFPKGFDHRNSVTMLYTIGTIHNGSNDSIFSEDMDVIEHYINFYSDADNIPTLIGNRTAPTHTRVANLSVLLEPEKNYAPTHQEFSGNIQMGPWITLIPNMFKNFVWGKSYGVCFFKNKPPQIKML